MMLQKKLVMLFALLLGCAQLAFSEGRHVRGRVIDETGQGLPGAGITVKTTTIGTVTDVDGNFELDVPDGKEKLVVKALGYNDKEINATTLPADIKLAPSSKQLEGTVVSALGVKREKRELGYSSTTVSNEDLTSGNGSSALSDLQGKVAGANITSSTGGPGGSTRIVLRGEKSILKNNNALIVIDGVIMNNYDRTSDASGLAQVDFGNSANDIDPEEIESISVLEGPAAAALYGAAGANGAVMITTKSGKINKDGKNTKLDITVKSTFTASDVLKLPEYQSTFGQGAPGISSYDDLGDNFSWGAPFTGKLQPWGQSINGQQLVKPYAAISDPLRQFYQTGKNFSNFVSLSGGTETSTYFLSLSSVNSDGVTPNTYYDKYSVRFNGTTQLPNNFYSSVNVNYITNSSRVEATGQASGSVMQNLLQIPVDIPIAPLADLNNKFYSMDFVDSAGIHRFGYFGSFAKNPYWIAQNYSNTNKSDHILGDLNLGYKKGDFNVYDRVGADVSNERASYETPKINVQSVSQNSYYPSYPVINPGGYQQILNTAVRFYNDAIITYTRKITSDIGINATLGDNITLKTDENLNTNINPSTNGLAVAGLYNFSNNIGPITVTNTLTEYRTTAAYADVKLNYQREIFLELTARNEWSSTLISSNNSYFYPGGNISWVFTERLNDNVKKFLDYGKVRFGSAGVSNDAIPYANNNALFYQQPINSAFGAIVPPFNAVPAVSITSSFGDNHLKPELTTEYEVGTELSFFKSKLSLSFTYYDDYTHNLITNVPTPPSTGFLTQYINLGDISNKGEEISVRGTVLTTKKGLKWDVFGTYTHNVSNVESLNGKDSIITIGGFSGMAIVAAPGHPFGSFYAADIATENGHTIVDANSGLPVPTSKPQLLGSFQPKFQASWGTDVAYKGFKLHVLFVTKQGGMFYSEDKALMDFVGSSVESANNNRLPTVWANSVNAVGKTNPTYVPNTTAYNAYSYWVNMVGSGVLPAQNLVDASFVKLQEIALSYKIPQKYYNRTPFGSLEVSIFGNNLFIWTASSNKYDDPEATSSGAVGNAQGFNYSSRPTLRNYGASLKITF
jgi:TonB-linked SusC/RagA family outer membrane protein